MPSRSPRQKSTRRTPGPSGETLYDISVASAVSTFVGGDLYHRIGLPFAVGTSDVAWNATQCTSIIGFGQHNRVEVGRIDRHCRCRRCHSHQAGAGAKRSCGSKTGRA